MCNYVCKLVPYCDTSDETDTLSLETMFLSISNKGQSYYYKFNGININYIYLIIKVLRITV